MASVWKWTVNAKFLGVLRFECSEKGLIRVCWVSGGLEVPDGTSGCPWPGGALEVPDGTSGQPLPVALKDAMSQLRAYLDQPPAAFTAAVDLAASGLTAKEQAVLQNVRSIPFGTTRSYGQIGAETGTGAKFVGATMAKNPLPIVIPCHRVVNADGTPGGYTGGQGPAEKQQLLEFEKHTVKTAGMGGIT